MQRLWIILTAATCALVPQQAVAKQVLDLDIDEDDPAAQTNTLGASDERMLAAARESAAGKDGYYGGMDQAVKGFSEVKFWDMGFDGNSGTRQTL